MLRWLTPSADFVKINVNGCQNSNGDITARGLIRGSEGEWFGGFSIKIGKGCVLEAEIRGLWLELELAQNLCFREIEVESDNKEAIELIKLFDKPFHPLGNQIASIRLLRNPFDSL